MIKKALPLFMRSTSMNATFSATHYKRSDQESLRFQRYPLYWCPSRFLQLLILSLPGELWTCLQTFASDSCSPNTLLLSFSWLSSAPSIHRDRLCDVFLGHGAMWFYQQHCPHWLPFPASLNSLINGATNFIHLARNWDLKGFITSGMQKLRQGLRMPGSYKMFKCALTEWIY